MHVLHLISSLDQSTGGPAQVAANLALAQVKKHQVTVVSHSDEDTVRGLIPDSRVRVVCVPESFVETWLGFNARKELRRLVADVDFFHLHNTWCPILLAGAAIANQMGKPYCLTPHGMLDPWSLSQKKLKKKIALMLGRRKLIERANFVHVLNQDEAVGIKKLGIKNQCQIIPNGVQLESIDKHLNPVPFQESAPAICEGPFILFLARLHFKKGLDILADCIGPFLEKHPEWKFVIAGPDGGAQADFESRIESAGVESSVHLVGPIYGAMKYSLLANCEIFCLPSRQEGFSVAILEAMAASKAVAISTECHFPEVKQFECGTVDPVSAPQITESLFKLASSADFRNGLGRNGRKLVEERYQWSIINEDLIDAYQMCIDSTQ